MDKEAINQRFVGLVQYLKGEGIIRTQAEFYEKIGIHEQTYYDIKANKRSLTIEILSNLLSIYKINPIYMLTGDLPITMQGNMQGCLQGLEEELNETMQKVEESQKEYKTAKMRELETENIRLKAQNEAYFNVIKALGGEKDTSIQNSA